MAILVFIVILWNYPNLMTYRILFPTTNNLNKTKISRHKDIMKQKYIT